MEIYFLTPEQAYPRLQNLYINTGCTRAHYGAIKQFSQKQKQILMSLISTLPVPVGKIEFVLLESGVYWDFPFTWGTTMIMVTPKIFTKPVAQIRKILAHEWVHLDQRRDPDKYHRYYTSLGFQQRKIDYGSLQPYLLRNPDANKYEWIWQDSKGGPIYAPIATLYNCKFKTSLLELKRSKHGTRAIIHDVEDVPDYYNRFGTKRQLYHPNEITAHLLADFLVDGVKHVHNLESLLQ